MPAYPAPTMMMFFMQLPLPDAEMRGMLFKTVLSAENRIASIAINIL
jgi:hypothetical protein